MNARRLIVAGAAGVAGVIGAASVAYACVPFYGTAQVNVSGAGTPQNSGTVTGNDVTTSHQYCDDTQFATSTEAQAKGGNTITVAINASTASGCVGQLDERNHTVIINNATTAATSPFTWVSGVGSWSFRDGTGCFRGGGQPGNKTLDTSFSVNAGGAGTKTYTLPTMNSADATNLASALCVGHPDDDGNPDVNNSEGIFVPIKIEATI